MDANAVSWADSQVDRANILVVDDRPSNVRLLKGILEKQGYKVRAVLNGAAAIVAATTQPPDLILLDIMMPEMDGYTVCETLKAQAETQHIPVIFLSALNALPHLSKAFAVGGVDYLTKPINAQEALMRIQNHLRASRWQKELRQRNEQLQREIERRQVAESQLQQANEVLEIQVEARSAELKQRYEQLQESEEKFRQLAENIRELFYIYELPSRHWVYVSPGFELIWGYDRHRLYEDSELWLAAIHPEDRERISNSIQAQTTTFLENGEIANNHQDEYRIIRSDGEVRWICNRNFPVRDREGKVYRIVGIAEDITERIQAEIHLKQLNEELEARVATRTAELRRQNKALKKATQAAAKANLAKNEFLANMSHEIRTPLNAILGFSNLLIATLNDKTQHSYLEAIISNGQMLLALINDILDLAKLEDGQLKLRYEPVELRRLLASIQYIFTEVARQKNLGLFVEVNDIIPEKIVIDEVRLRQILLNIVGNAIKFTHQGYVKILASGSEDMSEFNLEIRVEDTGIGIPPEQQDQIFAAFMQNDSKSTRRYGGTGLGLTITQRLMAMMGGTVSLISHVEQGSTFILKFPKVTVAEDNSDPSLSPNSLIFPNLEVATLKANVLHHQPVNLPSSLPSETISKLPELLDRLQEILEEIWQPLRHTLTARNLKEFAQSLHDLAQDYTCSPLHFYATTLSTQLEAFDWEHLPQTVESFPEVIQSLARLTHER
jgi:PAS domain S-box-containing protein